uniref:Alcohol dehydrogenase-like C-terminal domain-containing protein n=1 Tax=Callorhinchus milii TaxID=7868 RepID=A0A4W3HKX5_CALMI
PPRALLLTCTVCCSLRETVLVTAAAGAAGLAAVDIASHVLNAQVIAAVGSDEKCDLAVQRGAIAAINYTTQSLKEEAKRLTANKGVNVALDAVGCLDIEALRFSDCQFVQRPFPEFPF